MRNEDSASGIVPEIVRPDQILGVGYDPVRFAQI
jgi:hypothetical protein